MNVYTTQKGDTWDSIAYGVYGDEKKAGLLMSHNAEYIGIAVFDYGAVLVVPDRKESENISHKPPWRR
jgi:phage tail protein X|nr:MAG TPA: baseplate wedge protein [Caudoviricetes sp.]